MEEIGSNQFLFVAVLVFLMMIIIPVLQKRTGKDLTQMLFGIKSRKAFEGRESIKATKEPRVRNGTKSELTSFVAQLLRFTSKNGMRLVAPGTISHNGKTARLTALVVAPGGIIGIYCLGFGGTISPGDPKAPAGKASPWRQHINGEDKTFDNPIKACEEQKELIQAAMEQAGIHTQLTVLTVFTNAQAMLQATPAFVYNPKNLLQYLKDEPSLKSGSLDIHGTAQTLAKLAGIKKDEPEKKHGKSRK
ncbi:MAG: hypothetical protein HFG54_03430 [Lachnospiraceae bacterium]|jgi:hypothetical protein|nr:hypothetical protein [Lachnospiraceae bacterium]